MEEYKNLSGNSGVEKFLVGADFIKIRFKNMAKIYVYSHTKPGATHVEKMKELAEAGRGLSTYVSQKIKKNYYRTEPLGGSAS